MLRGEGGEIEVIIEVISIGGETRLFSIICDEVKIKSGSVTIQDKGKRFYFNGAYISHVETKYSCAAFNCKLYLVYEYYHPAIRAMIEHIKSKSFLVLGILPELKKLLALKT